MITTVGMWGSLITSVFATHIMVVDAEHKIERTLKLQLIISTVLLTPLLYVAAAICLQNMPTEIVNKYFLCSVMGLWGGLIIGA